MLRSVLLSAAALGLLLVSPTIRAQTVAPSTISYQGVLTDAAGVPVPDGTTTVQLRLFTVATSGTAVYTETHNVATAGGVFSVEIGAGTPGGLAWTSVHFDRSYWLETVVNGTALAPRTRLLAAPYARSLTPGARIGAPTAGSALTAAGIIETTAGGIRYPDGTTQTTAGGGGLTLPFEATVSSPTFLFAVTNTSASGIRGIGVQGVRGESASTTGQGVRGQATATTGVNYGGWFQSASVGGRGVYGNASSTTGTTYGVYGQAVSSAGTGVYGTALTTGVQGISTATSGLTYGGRFESASGNGHGVRGENIATTGQAYGVYGRTASTSGVGVQGFAEATTGSTDGVVGQAVSTAGTGVRGTATATTGSTYGGYFRSSSSAGTGVYGWASSTSGENYGVAGVSAGASGRGVLGSASGATAIAVQGVASATSGVNYAGYFETMSTSGRGVVGEADATSGVTYGGYFRAVSTSGRGLVGSADAASGTTYGGYFFSASPAGYGLYAINGAGGIAARIAGASRFDANMEFYDGADRRVVIDVDEGGEAPSLKLLRGGTTVLELDADHNGDSRVITQELEITGGSDLAEAFDVATTAETAPAPGLVVSIDPAHPGRLAVSATPYDPLVAGVMSGAGGVEAGLIMGQRGSVADGEHAVALVGRVYVWTDASYGAVRPGDFLTTSATPGHAMRAGDAERRTGAVLGKAMTALESGRGLVLVLVSLQ